MKAIRSAHIEKKPWKSCLTEFLRTYRSTPHATTSFSTHKLLFGREPRTKLPSLPQTADNPIDDAVRHRDTIAKEKMKDYADSRAKAKQYVLQCGDTVADQKHYERKQTLHIVQSSTSSHIHH